jgi:hypothetical protein
MYAEVHLYNNKHPRGRKYHPDELRGHRKQWLEICRKYPSTFTEPLEYADGGPLSGLVTELEFNHMVSRIFGCPFETFQFQRAISEGILSLLDDNLRDSIMFAYTDIKIANQDLQRLARLHPTEVVYREKESVVRECFKVADKTLLKALEDIHNFLGRE